MKLAFLLFLPLFLSLSHAEIIGVEQFDYPDGSIAGKNGGTFWDYDNVSPAHTGTASNWDSPFGTPTVTSGRLVTAGNSVAKREYNGSSQDNGAVNEVNVAKKVFYRVSVTTGATIGESDYFGFSSLDFEDEKLYFGKSGGSTTFGLEEVGVASNASSFEILPNKTYLLVAVVDFVNDSIRLYVDPVLNGSEPVAATAALPYTGSNWSTAVRFASDTSVSWDDLVVATTWEDLGTVVTTLDDEDDGAFSLNTPTDISLREAVKYSPPGSLITFDDGFSGGTITLTLGQLLLDKSLNIDASTLARGITIDANGAVTNHRVMEIQRNNTVTLRGLTLTGGRATVGSIPAVSGGAIYANGSGSGNSVRLTLIACTLSGNTAGEGGGILIDGNQGTATLSLTSCTLSGNSAGFGGGGGIVIAGIEGSATLNLTSCTLSGNSADDDFGGGGIVIAGSLGTATLNLHNTILAGNTATTGPDLLELEATTTASGTNLMSSTAGSTLGANSANITIVADPKLSPLGYFGGPVQTMHPLIGSPAIDAIVTTDPGGTDARGFPRYVDGNTSSPGAQLDIGAVEAGPLRMVSFTSDPGTSSSLRGRIASSVEPGARIGFNTDPNTPIILGSELNIPEGRSIFIDASNLSAPATISGDNQFRVFNIPATATVAMHSVRIINGDTLNPFGPGAGILNSGTCTVISSTLTGNLASSGGGIHNNGMCTVISSTLSGNGGFDQGGGIFSSGTCTVISSTLSGNFASGGGGIRNSGTCTVISSTLTGNTADDEENTGTGGGIRNSATLHLSSSIVAGNTAGISNNIAGSLVTDTNNLTSGNPLLAPLGDYGGTTQTMPPLPGSPAIDAAAGTTAQTDQRGFSRTRDGDGNGTATPDIGAVEASLSAVANTNNEGPGSLRQAVLEAAAQPGPDTIYFTAAVTGPIMLTTEIDINDTTGGVTIDAIDRPTGLTLDGGNATRHFEVLARSSLTLRGLTLKRGNGSGGSGGSIRNDGTLNLHRCTLTGNASTSVGGAISSSETLRATDCTFSENTASTFGGGVRLVSGTAEFTRCTVSGNTAGTGGGIWQQGVSTTTTLSHCTIAGNRSTVGSSVGGIVAFSGTLTLQHCTVSQNTGNGFGGGLYLQGSATVNVNFCIIAGNTDPGSNRADIFFVNNGPTLNATGTNLISSNESVASQFPAVANLVGTAAAPVNPKLSPLGSYGGPTQTMPPLAGSPAIDAGGASSTFTTDQRGFPRVVDGNNSSTAQTDIGAVESAFRFVTNNSDSSSGSLRQAVLDAAAAPGWEAIAFDRMLNAGTISLTTADPTSFTTGIVITDIDGVAIDASSLPGGLTITKPTGDYRLFLVTSGARLSLHQLTLTGGSVSDDFGGAIYNLRGTLNLSDCTLTGNTALDGGAIFSSSSSIDSGRFTEIRRCTLTGNTATSGIGGAIHNSLGKATVLFSTLSGNTGGGIASYGNTDTLTEVTSSIVSGNTGGDVVFTNGANNSFLSRGHNLIGTGNGSPVFNQTGDIINNADPLLAPLTNNGGPTQTMALRPGSPARNAGAPTGRTTDQRGFPLVGLPDIGAFEAQFGTIADVTTAEDTAATTASFGVGQTGTLTATSSNTALVPNANIVINGSGASRTVTMTPATNRSGTATITLFDTGVEIQTFLLTVTAVNDKPTITNITNQSINEDATTGAVAFTIGDVETAAASLTLTRSSNNTALVPLANIVLGGSGANRTVTVTPAANQSGTATITVSVSDATATTSDTFVVTVTAVNDAPTIANITDRTINEDTNTGAVPFTIGDVETAATALTLTRASSNTTLVPLANVVIGGSGANRTVTVTPAANQSGTATITVTVSDGTATTSDTFLLTVTSVNDAPSFTKGANISVANNPGAQTVTGWATALSAGPANESTQTLGFTVTNSNNALFTAQPAIAANGTLTFTPATTASGSATVTVRINDNGGTTNGGVNQSAAQTFTITVALPIIVTNTAATGTGSLRQAIANAAINPGAETVTFAPGLSGTIVLTSEIPITDTAGVTIDATALPASLTVSGGNATRHFHVQAGKILTLRGLTLTAGRVTGQGGAVHNAGTLNLDRCTFSGNASTSNGGAIASIGTLSVTNCTLSGNTTSGTGGGLFSNGTCTVLFSTISANTAVEGGGVSTLQTFHLTASIVAGNTATTALPNIKGTLTTNAQNLTTGDPLLAPLAGYGGLTFTMPPFPGSLAINAATGRTRTTDQRGFPSVGFPDIGAAEFQGNTDLRRFWNTDWDGDGTHFGLEFALGTNPRLSDPASPNNLVLSAATNGNPVITFGRNPAANSTTTWRLTRSTTLLADGFTEIFRFTGPTGTPVTNGSTFVGTATSFQITDTTPPPGKAFYRIEAISP